MVNTQEFSSAGTSINSKKVPAVFKLVDTVFGWEPGTSNIDWGGGKYDTATEFLEAKQVVNTIYDPFNRTEAENIRALSSRNYDTGTLSNVLNVIREHEIRIGLVKDLLTHLKPGGTLYVTVYEGDRSGTGRKSKDGCWQENRKLRSYQEELSEFDPAVKKGILIIKKKKY